MLSYTPRQLAALLIIANRRHRVELAEQLAVQRLAAHGESDAVRKQIQEWGES